MPEKIHIFDTTLRDAEQTPGAALNLEEKLEIAKHLAKLNVDIIEAGFPVSSPGDFDAVERIANEVEGPEICALSRVIEKDITAAWGAIKDAPRPRIHTFVYACPPEEVRRFTQDLDFLELLAGLPTPTADEVLAACLRQASTAYDRPHEFLMSAGRAVATFLGGDALRLKGVLRRLPLGG